MNKRSPIGLSLIRKGIGVKPGTTIEKTAMQLWYPLCMSLAAWIAPPIQWNLQSELSWRRINSVTSVVERGQQSWIVCLLCQVIDWIVLHLRALSTQSSAVVCHRLCNRLGSQWLFRNKIWVSATSEKGHVQSSNFHQRSTWDFFFQRDPSISKQFRSIITPTAVVDVYSDTAPCCVAKAGAAVRKIFFGGEQTIRRHARFFRWV